MTEPLRAVRFAALRTEAEERWRRKLYDEVYDLTVSRDARRRRLASVSIHPNCMITAEVWVDRPGRRGRFQPQVRQIKDFEGWLLLDGLTSQTRIGFDNPIRAVAMGEDGVIYVSYTAVDPDNAHLRGARALESYEELLYLSEVKKLKAALEALAAR